MMILTTGTYLAAATIILLSISNPTRPALRHSVARPNSFSIFVASAPLIMARLKLSRRLRSLQLHEILCFAAYGTGLSIYFITCRPTLGEGGGEGDFCSRTFCCL